MRRKANAADIMYIEANSNNMTIEEISEAIDLATAAIEPHFAKNKKKVKLGRSKLTLKNGQSVYQMTEDIDPPKSGAKKAPSTSTDKKNGIYRG